MDWYGGGVGWAAWFVMAAMMVAFWGLLIVAVILVARSLGRDRSDPDASAKDAFEILDERLARGEIDPDEYQRRRDALLRRTHEAS